MAPCLNALSTQRLPSRDARACAARRAIPVHAAAVSRNTAAHQERRLLGVCRAAAPDSPEDGPVVFDLSSVSDSDEDEEEGDSEEVASDAEDSPAQSRSMETQEKASVGAQQEGQATGEFRGEGASVSGRDQGRRRREPRVPGDRMQAVDAAGDANNLYYQGTLTSADIAKDPVNHVSGYIAIIGRPNAGKSTILNALVGQKLSIVSHKAQTTRHRILGILSTPRSQAVLIDTPGVIDVKRNMLEGRMMSVVKTAMREADAVVAIVDVARSPEAVLAMVQPPPDFQGPPLCIVLNKMDLVTPERLAEIKTWWETNCRCDAVLCTSALDAVGSEEVREWMVSKLPLGPTLYPKELVSEHPEKFFVSEIVREHIFKLYNEEVPYAVQVNVTDFKERARGKDFVACDLVCERKAHMGILLGKNGSAMKALATAARLDIEGFLGRPVYLEMKVRHDKDWRKNVATLKDFGY